MEQIPSWVAYSNLSQRILYPVWSPELHYHVNKSSPLVSILSQMNPVYTLPPYFFKIPSMPRSSKCSLPFTFSDQTFGYICHLYHACCMSPHLIFLDFITPIIFGEVYKLWSSSLCSFLQHSTILSLVHIFSSAPCFQRPSVCICSLVWETQVFHPYKRQVKLWFCVLCFEVTQVCYVVT